MIRATEADRGEIEAFLTPLSEYAMFPLSNLAHHGMNGGHPHAVTFWITRKADRITDVLTQTEAGNVIPVLPSQDYTAAAAALDGRAVAGIIGSTHWARGLEAACHLTAAASTLNRDEPHYLLNLADLHTPEGPGALVPLSDVAPPIIKAWMAEYEVEALHTPPADAPAKVDQSYARLIAAGSHKALVDGTTPLAMTGLNARLPHIVQVGGVYTPIGLRGQRHARRAVALHLAEAKAQGVTRATLFSANPSASRAYQAIGFRQTGLWTLLLYRDTQVAHA